MAPSRKDDPAGDVFADMIREHVRRVEQRVPAAVVDKPDAVHQLRTAVRRLRTVLAVYGAVFDEADADALRTRLAEFGAVLGTVRDLEVRRAGVESVGRRARVSLAARERLVVDLDDRHADAHRDLVAWCSGDEMRDLTADLVSWVAGPPLSCPVDAPARKLVRKGLRKAVRRVRRAADDVDFGRLADATVDTADSDALFTSAHRVRKAGRRLAHAARAVTDEPTDVLGSQARRLADIGKNLQSSLGDHRDAVLLARHVLDAAEAVERGRGDRGPYDRLARAAQRHARTVLVDAEAAVVQLRATAR